MDLLDDEALIDTRRRAKATDPAAVLEEERGRRAAPPVTRVEAGPAPRPSDARVADGVCALCRARPARGTCTLCGRAACAADLWIMLRLCRACASEGDVERGQRGAQPERGNWLADTPHAAGAHRAATKPEGRT